MGAMVLGGKWRKMVAWGDLAGLAVLEFDSCVLFLWGGMLVLWLYGGFCGLRWLFNAFYFLEGEEILSKSVGNDIFY